MVKLLMKYNPWSWIKIGIKINEDQHTKMKEEQQRRQERGREREKCVSSSRHFSMGHFPWLLTICQILYKYRFRLTNRYAFGISNQCVQTGSPALQSEHSEFSLTSGEIYACWMILGNAFDSMFWATSRCVMHKSVFELPIAPAISLLTYSFLSGFLFWLFVLYFAFGWLYVVIMHTPKTK